MAVGAGTFHRLSARIDSMSSLGLQGVATWLFFLMFCILWSNLGPHPTSSENACCGRRIWARVCTRVCVRVRGGQCVRVTCPVLNAGVACRHNGSGHFLSSFVMRRTRGPVSRGPDGDDRSGSVERQRVHSVGPDSCCLGRQRGAWLVPRGRALRVRRRGAQRPPALPDPSC